MKKIIIFLLISISILTFSKEKYSIKGKIYFKEKGKIFVYIFDEETFKVPFTGNQVLILNPDSKIGIIEFEIKNIPKGKYGIRCFQDVNDNGKLDRGLFGPKEPWWISWKNNKKKKFPKFDKISFKITKDIKNYIIKMEK